jgi:hypothetical protein
MYLCLGMVMVSVLKLTWMNPVRVASPHRINLEEPVRVASPHRINSFLCLSVSLSVRQSVRAKRRDRVKE